MRKTAICLSAVLAVATIPVLAQSSTDTLAALLAEVRLLRIAMERTATAPQIQLLGTRLSVQNDRLQRATQDHQTARNALQELLDAVAQHTLQLQSTEEDARATPASSTPELSQRQQELAARVAALKEQLAILAAREPQLRARESELAAAVATEQNEWMLLNRRLDEFERALSVR